MTDSRYWDEVAREWLSSPRDLLWRRHSDAINAALCARWLGDSLGRILKTDLFDEAVSGGWYPLNSAPHRSWFALDLSSHIARAATRQRPGLCAVAADVRRLPWPDGSFDTILSPSTLDHLATRQELCAALGELARALRPGGRLIVTLDNPYNPVLMLRGALPARWLRAIGLTPYATGATLGPRALRAALESAGLRVADCVALLHCPRAWAVARARALAGAPVERQRRFTAGLARWEALAHWPSRWLTGYYVAALALKPGMDQQLSHEVPLL